MRYTGYASPGSELVLQLTNPKHWTRYVVEGHTEINGELHRLFSTVVTSGADAQGTTSIELPLRTMDNKLLTKEMLRQSLEFTVEEVDSK